MIDSPLMITPLREPRGKAGDNRAGFSRSKDHPLWSSNNVQMFLNRFRIIQTMHLSRNNPGRNEMDSLELPGIIDSLEIVQDFVRRRFDQLDLSADLIHEIRLVVEELYANIVFHAYPDRPGNVRVRCFMDSDGSFCIRFMDWGIPFNPLTCKPPNLEEEFGDRAIGGLGIHLVKQLVHALGYDRKGNSNVLTVCFQTQKE